MKEHSARRGRAPDSGSGSDKRRFQRNACDLRMTYSILSSRASNPFEFGVAQAKNLSENGVCIFTEQEIQVPVLLQLNVNLPMRPFHMLLLGKALRCQKTEGRDLYEIGIKFVGILPPEFKRLVSVFPSSGEAELAGDSGTDKAT